MPIVPALSSCRPNTGRGPLAARLAAVDAGGADFRFAVLQRVDVDPVQDNPSEREQGAAVVAPGNATGHRACLPGSRWSSPSNTGSATASPSTIPAGTVGPPSTM